MSKIYLESAGTHLSNFVDDYVIVDLETTGFSKNNDEIIEIGAIKVIDNKIFAEFQCFVKISGKINNKITNLTKITDKMIQSEGKEPLEAIKEFDDFVGKFVLIGHNIKSFDIGFLNKYYNTYLSKSIENDYIDTYIVAKQNIDTENYKLETLIQHFDIKNDKSHRALNDAHACFELVKKFKDLDFNNFNGKNKRINKNNKKSFETNVLSISKEIDVNNILYEKTCVFSGKFKITKSEAEYLVKCIGGNVNERITLKTDFLIIANGEKEHSKLIKAKELQTSGHNIKIISEEDFYRILDFKP